MTLIQHGAGGPQYSVTQSQDEDESRRHLNYRKNLPVPPCLVDAEGSAEQETAGHQRTEQRHGHARVVSMPSRGGRRRSPWRRTGTCLRWFLSRQTDRSRTGPQVRVERSRAWVTTHGLRHRITPVGNDSSPGR